MTFKQKIIFIISLAFFQIFYLLSTYTGQYLNSFFLLTCLTATILCYNLYQLLMQLFTSEKVEAELNLLKKQQLLNSEHLLLMNQQEATYLKPRNNFQKISSQYKNFCMKMIAKMHRNSFTRSLKLSSVTAFILIAKIILFLPFWNPNDCLLSI